METKLIISPKTRVAELLDAYPELEIELIGIAPAFKNLKNPVLRKTIAKVTTLKQAAAIGKVPVDEVVNKLREIVGQANLLTDSEDEGYITDKPLWFDEEKIKYSYDARADIASGGHPLSKVMGDLKSVNKGDIYELITPFLPAPLLDNVKAKGFLVWSEEATQGLYKNYFILQE
ncbi:MAG: DUF1858 domain-containing protein [Bacteroidales bacterium]|nr:DUF1858 domain-containing protein [Bacteroidales bacterium]MCF8402834.1 DUF1858 domain-containing protein [Bacteroidales bacterium]